MNSFRCDLFQVQVDVVHSFDAHPEEIVLHAELRYDWDEDEAEKRRPQSISLLHIVFCQLYFVVASTTVEGAIGFGSRLSSEFELLL